jgi:uncharacterized RDD family membrane protein YckC
MENVRIQTTQNVDIEYQLASVGDRILATVIDFLFFFVYILVLAIIADLTGAGNVAENRGVAAIAFLPLMLYNLLCELFFQGKSFGKMLMKIQVVKLDGTQAGFSNYLLRWLLRVVDILICQGVIALIVIIVNGKGQRLGDIAAGTTVIKLKQRTTIQDTILKNIKPDYTIVFKNVSLLTDNDVAIIKEVLEFSRKHDNYEAIQKLALKTQQVMGVTSDLSFVKFLETVIMDYNHYHFDK